MAKAGNPGMTPQEAQNKLVALVGANNDMSVEQMKQQIQKLCAIGANVNLPCDLNSAHIINSDYPLNVAARNGCIAAINALVDSGAKVKLGEPPLCSAVGGGHIEAIKTLVGRGADLNARNIYGIGALYIAVCLKEVEVIKALVSLGANINPMNVHEAPLVYEYELPPTDPLRVFKVLIMNGVNVDHHTTGQLKKLKQLSIYIFCVVYAPQRQC